MSGDDLDREVLSLVGIDRRQFVKRLMVGSAFAVPVVASFVMAALTSAAGEQSQALANGVSFAQRRTHYFPYSDYHHGDPTYGWR